MRVKIVLSYDGSKFNGFQAQRDGRVAVANKIEEALKNLGCDARFNASGRTDRGVHATYQVIDLAYPNHFRELDRFKIYLDRQLSSYIKIRDVSLVDDDFHSRFFAKSRLYRYIFKNAEPTPFESDYLLGLNKELDLAKIKSAVRLFEGEHDFFYFQKSGSDVKSTIRTIKRARFYQYKNYYIFSVEADGFLRSQIRMMVAFLLKIDSNDLSLKDLKDQIDCKKVSSREVAKPNGLYLSKVKY